MRAPPSSRQRIEGLCQFTDGILKEASVSLLVQASSRHDYAYDAGAASAEGGCIRRHCGAGGWGSEQGLQERPLVSFPITLVIIWNPSPQRSEHFPFGCGMDWVTSGISQSEFLKSPFLRNIKESDI